jgi:hypothetical protein
MATEEPVACARNTSPDRGGVVGGKSLVEAFAG